MPITIQLPQNVDGSWIGPGASVVVQSDFVGPLPSDTQWNYKVILGSDETPVWTELHFQNTNPDTNVIMVRDSRKSSGRTQNQPTDDEPVRLVVELQTSTGILDQGSVDTRWKTTQALGQQAFLQPATQAAGGFTDSDRALLIKAETQTQVLGQPQDLVIQAPSGPLQTTVAQLFSRETLDMFTLAELTSGPTGDPVRVTMREWYWGIIVRVTTIPEDLVPRTPDAQWYFPDLAVLRVFRGVDLEHRWGIHTPTFQTERPYELGWLFLNHIPILGDATERTIAVDWRLGCEGQVYLQRLP